jgi:hypothetical protein
MNMMITLHWLTIILQVIPGEIDEFEGVPESIVVNFDTVREAFSEEEITSSGGGFDKVYHLKNVSFPFLTESSFTGIGYYRMKNNT